MKTAEERREYQRAYYKAHAEKAKEYQRQYNLTHKKSSSRKGRHREGSDIAPVAKGQNFNASNLMHAPTDKAIKMFNAILKGQATLAR